MIPNFPNSDFWLHIHCKSALRSTAQQAGVGGGGLLPITAGKHCTRSLIVTLQIVFGVPAPFDVTICTVMISAKSKKVIMLCDLGTIFALNLTEGMNIFFYPSLLFCHLKHTHIQA